MNPKIKKENSFFSKPGKYQKKKYIKKIPNPNQQRITVGFREGYPARSSSSAAIGLTPIIQIQIFCSREVTVMEEWLCASFKCEENGCSFLLSSRLAEKILVDFLKEINILYKEAVSSFTAKILY